MVCNHCKIDKSEDQFWWSNKKLNKKCNYCRECGSMHKHRYHYRHRDRLVARSKKQYHESRVRIKKYIFDYLLTHPCVVCGERDTVVLEFDHVKREDKVLPIGNMRNHLYSLEKIKSEIKKCQVLCANCHRRKTATDLGWNKEHQYFNNPV